MQWQLRAPCCLCLAIEIWFKSQILVYQVLKIFCNSRFHWKCGTSRPVYISYKFLRCGPSFLSSLLSPSLPQPAGETRLFPLDKFQPPPLFLTPSPKSYCLRTCKPKKNDENCILHRRSVPHHSCNSSTTPSPHESESWRPWPYEPLHADALTVWWSRWPDDAYPDSQHARGPRRIYAARGGSWMPGRIPPHVRWQTLPPYWISQVRRPLHNHARMPAVLHPGHQTHMLVWPVQIRFQWRNGQDLRPSQRVPAWFLLRSSPQKVHDVPGVLRAQDDDVQAGQNYRSYLSILRIVITVLLDTSWHFYNAVLLKHKSNWGGILLWNSITVTILESSVVYYGVVWTSFRLVPFFFSKYPFCFVRSIINQVSIGKSQFLHSLKIIYPSSLIQLLDVISIWDNEVHA